MLSGVFSELRGTSSFTKSKRRAESFPSFASAFAGCGELAIQVLMNETHAGGCCIVVMTQNTQSGSLLTISVTRIEGRVVVSLGGRLTIDSSPELRNQLLAVLYGETLENLIIDLSDVPYVDLSGVATLLETLRVARGRNTGLQLRGLHDRPRYLLEVTGLLSLFETGGLNVPSIQKAQ